MNNKVYIYHNDKNENQPVEVIKLNCKQHKWEDVELSYNDKRCIFCSEDCIHSRRASLVYIKDSDESKTLMGFMCCGCLDWDLSIQYGMEKEIILTSAEYDGYKDKHKHLFIELTEKEREKLETNSVCKNAGVTVKYRDYNTK